MSKRMIFDYLVTFLMLVVSGTVFATMLHGSLSIVIFFLVSLCYAAKYKEKFDKKQITYLYVYSIFLLMSAVFVGGFDNAAFNMVLGYILLATGAFFIMQTISFERFRYYYLNLTFFIALTSVVLYILWLQNLISLTVVYGPLNDVYLMYFFNNFGWGYPFERLAGPYWEPGVFQIILISAIMFYFNEISQFKFNVPLGKIKLIVIVVAILMTQSTAGYINMFLVAIAAIMNMNITRRNFIKTFIVIILLICGCFYLVTSDVYTEKMSRKGEKGYSYEIRKADNLAMLNMTYQKPLLGYGIASAEFAKTSRELGNKSSSNGLLAVTSQLGCIFLLLYLWALFNSVKKHYKKHTILVFLIFLMLQATEVFIFLPLSFVFLFAKARDADLCHENIISENVISGDMRRI